MTGFRIIPDVLTNSLGELEEKITVAAKLTDRLHVDVIDGVFAENKTLMPKDLVRVGWRGMKVDVQLMTDEPSDYLRTLQKAQVDRVFGHVEMMKSRSKFIGDCLKLNLVPGWGINIETELESFSENELDQVEAVILMSVKVGFSGQEFDDGVLVKIVELRKMGFEGDVVVDGGMKMDSIPLVLEAGANQFAVNSGLWQTDEVEKRYQLLNELLP